MPMKTKKELQNILATSASLACKNEPQVFHRSLDNSGIFRPIRLERVLASRKLNQEAGGVSVKRALPTRFDTHPVITVIGVSQSSSPPSLATKAYSTKIKLRLYMTQLFLCDLVGRSRQFGVKLKTGSRLSLRLGKKCACARSRADESLWSGSVFGEQALLQFFPEDFTASPRGADADQPPEDQDGRDQRY